VYEKVVSALRKSDEPLEPEVKHRFLESVMNILEKNRTTAQLELYPPSEIHILVSDLWKSSKQEYRKLAQEFVARFTDREWKYPSCTRRLKAIKLAYRC